MLKSHITRPSVLRVCKAAIDNDLFGKLVDYFPSADARVRLSPKYEGKRPIPEGKRPSREQQALDHFKLFRNAGLLATEGNLDLYFAAIKSKEVFLTPTGRHFWKIAHKERV